MAEQALFAANTRFAFKLFAELAQQSRGRNIFISPTSIALALSMTYNGARGETRRAISHALELGEMQPDDLNRANAGLSQSLQQLDPQVHLAIANSLWARAGLAFKPDFTRRNQEFYQAQIEQLDFADPRAPATINAWVKQNTNGKIERIVDQINRDALLFLINAIYFKGAWARQFDQRLTKDAPFTLLDGRPKQLPLMSQSGKYRYYEGQGFQSASLPYGGGRLSMYVFLPDQRSSLEAFTQELNRKRWDEWMPRYRETEGRIALPRFKLEYETTLNDALQALGMAIAFSSRADFGDMCSSEPHVCVDEVKHKTFVEVNEQGTEAAAVTSVGMMRASFSPQRTFSMIVDRPFFCAIRDNQTGTILFMGSIVEPK
jgi:serine protease inhibitor